MDIKIRRAQPNDAQRIWEIRNEPAALAVAANPEIIPLAQHIAWFNNKYVTDKNSICFVAEADQNVVGYSRFDLDKAHYVNSIAIVSSMHGKGIGTLLLKQSIDQLKPSLPVHAEVRKFNTVSIKMFERVGFKKVSEDDKNIYFQLT